MNKLQKDTKHYGEKASGMMEAALVLIGIYFAFEGMETILIPIFIVASLVCYVSSASANWLAHMLVEDIKEYRDKYEGILKINVEERDKEELEKLNKKIEKSKRIKDRSWKDAEIYYGVAYTFMIMGLLTICYVKVNLLLSLIIYAIFFIKAAIYSHRQYESHVFGEVKQTIYLLTEAALLIFFILDALMILPLPFL